MFLAGRTIKRKPEKMEQNQWPFISKVSTSKKGE